MEDDNGEFFASADDQSLSDQKDHISSLGLNVKIKQSQNPGADPNNINSNGLISGSVDYDDMNDRWLSGVPDRDDESQLSLVLWGFNWIRAGSYTNDNDGL